MLSLVTLFALLFTLGSTSPLSATLKSANSSSNIHAVLIAGSNGFYNYRHQADVCHAYHVLRSHGVPAENIIVFMYDDIANDSENPFPGQIFNIPNGPDVYAGVSKDYTGEDVTPENFLKVLKGDKELAAKGKKVLTSGPNDHVFVYYSDHGAVGLVGFPSSMLTSKDLNDALVYMHDNKQYGQLTFYLEACESGSMFQDILPDNINIYATTAATADESSWAAYCDVEGKLYGTCLGDEYSFAWLQDSDKQDLNKETLEQQFKNVVKATKQSSPQEYGAKSIATSEMVAEFQGSEPTLNSRATGPVPITGRVNSRDVPLVTLRRKIMSSNDASQASDLQRQMSRLIAGRKFLDAAIKKVVDDLCSLGFCSDAESMVKSHRSLVDHESYSQVAKKVHSACINLGQHSHALTHMYVFANLVEENQFDSERLQKFLRALENSCDTHVANHGFEAIV